jgi:hypothetical protein
MRNGLRSESNWKTRAMSARGTNAKWANVRSLVAKGG